MDIYKSVKIGIGNVLKIREILKLIPDYPKTKKTCKYAVKKLPFVIRYAPN